MPEPKPWKLVGTIYREKGDLWLWRHSACGFLGKTATKIPPDDFCRACSVMRLADAGVRALKTTRQTIGEHARHAETCPILRRMGGSDPCDCWVEKTLTELESVEEVGGERLLPDDRAELEKRISELETTGAADDARVEFLLRMIDANGHHSTNCSANSAGVPGSFLPCDCWLQAVRHDETIEPEPVRLVEDCLGDLEEAAGRLKACAAWAEKVIRDIENGLKETGIAVSALVEVREGFSIGWGQGSCSGRGPEWGLFYQFGGRDEIPLVSAPAQILLMAVPYLDTLATQLVKNAQRLLDGFEDPVEEGDERGAAAEGGERWVK